MSIPLLVSLTLSLVWAPLWSHQLLSNTFLKEKKIIALDNATILLARNERETLMLLSKFNRAISELEIAHHIIHPWVILGTAKPEVVAEDLKMELLINELHRNSGKLANAEWRSGKKQAEAELLRMGASQIEIQREDNAPVREISCPVCHLDSFWEIVPDYNKTHVRINDPNLMSGLRINFRKLSLIKGKTKNYQLVEG